MHSSNWQGHKQSFFQFKPQKKTFYDEVDTVKTRTNSGKKIYNASLVDDSKDTIEVSPNSPFKKIFKIKNKGPSKWNTYVELRWESGDLRSEEPIRNNTIVMEGEKTKFVVHLTSPSTPGKYITYWRLFHKKTGSFGPRFFFHVVVNDKAVDHSVLFAKQLDKLIGYGFKDQELNIRTLIKFNGDVSESVNFILACSDY
eukprot:TRINITY_DN7494_c0_g1_i2.p1 TRINITY_DN7494_c0_g1~~TRINITY_DN7494_c0_g1_i2.p1  ORF type:complete len:199 (-),score=55.93 TRINITY_DN7494_c0_g1_i2:52-648(-)